MSLPNEPQPCPSCGSIIDPTDMPLGIWDYVQTADGRTILQMIEPLDPRIIPFLKGVPIAHSCKDGVVELNDGVQALIHETEQFLQGPK